MYQTHWNFDICPELQLCFFACETSSYFVKIIKNHPVSLALKESNQKLLRLFLVCQPTQWTLLLRLSLAFSQLGFFSTKSSSSSTSVSLHFLIVGGWRRLYWSIYLCAGRVHILVTSRRFETVFACTLFLLLWSTLWIIFSSGPCLRPTIALQALLCLMWGFWNNISGSLMFMSTPSWILLPSFGCLTLVWVIGTRDLLVFFMPDRSSAHFVMLVDLWLRRMWSSFAPQLKGSGGSLSWLSSEQSVGPRVIARRRLSAFMLTAMIGMVTLYQIQIMLREVLLWILSVVTGWLCGSLVCQVCMCS